MITLFNKIRIERFQKKYGINNVRRLKTNPIPAVILIILVLIGINLLWSYTLYVSDFLYWFVDLLKLTKVLKLKFLSQKKYYDYVAYFVFAYIAISLAIDIFLIVSGHLLLEIYFTADKIFFYRFGIMGKGLRTFSMGSGDLSYSIKTGFLRKAMGLERIIIHTPGGENITSPFIYQLQKGPLLGMLMA